MKDGHGISNENLCKELADRIRSYLDKLLVDKLYEIDTEQARIMILTVMEL